MDGIVEELGDFVTVINAKTDEREDAHCCCESRAIFYCDTLFWSDERVEVVDEVREQMRECRVEVGIEFLKLLLLHFRRACGVVQLLILFRLHHLVHLLPLLLNLVDIL